MALLQEEEDVKPWKYDPVARQKHCIRKIGRKLIKQQECKKFPWVTKLVPLAKGCVASKGTARQARTIFFAVKVVSDLTLFSMSFFSGFVGDTREGSVKPEYVHNLEILAYSS
jgi:hypothetical protein